MVFQFIKANWNHMSTRAYLGYNRESGTENLSDTPNKKRVQHFHMNPIERERTICDWDGDWPHWSIIFYVSGMKRQRTPVSGVSVQLSPHCWCDLFQRRSLCLLICLSGPDSIPCLWPFLSVYLTSSALLGLESELKSVILRVASPAGFLICILPSRGCLWICQQGQLELPEFCFNSFNPFVAIK